MIRDSPGSHLQPFEFRSRVKPDQLSLGGVSCLTIMSCNKPSIPVEKGREFAADERVQMQMDTSIGQNDAATKYSKHTGIALCIGDLNACVACLWHSRIALLDEAIC